MQNIELNGKTVLVTGAAGFIGNNLVCELLRTVQSIHVVGIDIMSDYNPVEMKEYRLRLIEEEVQKHPDSSWTFIKGDIADVPFPSLFHPAPVLSFSTHFSNSFS